jgi:glycosyltransferase involved in cell wall biosynthesis
MINVLICVHSTNKQNDKFLTEALLSLNSQTYKDFKTIIVLDECWDETKSILESIEFYNKFLVIERDKKEGLAYAKNYGLSFVDTEYVAFLDADDLYEPTKLEKQVEFIKDNDVDFLGTHASNINVSNRELKTPSCLNENTYNSHEDITNALSNINPLTHGSMLIKMKTLKELGYYNHVVGAEDWDLWKRASKAGYKFHQLPERLYVWCAGSSIAR